MKNRIFAALGLASALFFTASGAVNAAPRQVPVELQSRLDKIAQVNGIGAVAYRAPLEGKTGPVLVLMHGVYGGASHLAFREILPLLDQANFRVFLFDSPGVGQSVKTKQEYTVVQLQDGLKGFLETVVKEPATVVAESVAGVAALDAAKLVPNLISKVIMLSPTGIRTLADEPTTAQNLLYSGLMASDLAGRKFYEALSTEKSVSYYAKKAYYNDTLVDSLRVAEGEIAGDNLEQRWITISFIGGRIHQKLADAALGVQQPTLAIFGANAESMTDDAEQVERPAEFQAAWPQLNIRTINECGASVQREKPADVASLIAEFVGV